MTAEVKCLIKQAATGEFDGAPKIQADSVCLKILAQYPEQIPAAALKAMRRVSRNAVKPEDVE